MLSYFVAHYKTIRIPFESLEITTLKYWKTCINLIVTCGKDNEGNQL